MRKTQVYLPEADLRALHRLALRRRKSVAALIREAIQRTYLEAAAGGPVALFRGKARRVSTDHDSIYDAP
ncbi:MAG: ribbon-helix-helix protein, CopG family [Myxococcaceae bacterium]|nr:ribbon-helix-helix protein, CopG family [Myxococcaceae bacterium]